MLQLEQEARPDIVAITPSLVEEYLVALNNVPASRRRQGVNMGLSDELPLLQDLVSARSAIETPQKPLPHHTVGKILEQPTSTYTVNNWQWLIDREQGVAQSVTRLLMQQGRRQMIVDVCSDPEPIGEVFVIGRRNYLPATEFSRMKNLLTHLADTRSHIKGWVSFAQPQ